ncbi:putative T7SS-secreted protein [Streptomyces tsukubensis]|uniref:Enoyl-CoA hydratase/isomerase family protein n=1 Tax=Streptomyces tsukubensis TaxID=83656 RepID=A0A1V4ABW5_9ACTN|nr:hypothetical protein [Streptomyces tsukubensis]OON81366.1 hypothetical protein B1H18_08525 [Streptomyces tsukubensis]QFR95508.1 enoyl-CoA hydratase/isomerase family protein [Streptomyces tsukubensis]
MTKRPAFPHIGWDPTPGDVEDTRELAKTLGGLAHDLGTTLRELERIESGGWQGKTAVAFSDHISEDVTPLIRDSHDSFDKASRALHRWAGELKDFQDEANRLETAAGKALDAKGKAKSGTDDMAKASGDVTTAESDVDDLEGRYRRAAAHIAKDLDKAGNIAPNEPGFWDKLGHGIEDAWKDAGKWLKDHADLIKLIGDLLGDLGGILAMIAIITAPFEPIGAIFATAAVVTSGLALVSHLVAKAAGADVSLVTIGLDALGSIPGIGAFSKGVKVADEATAATRAAKLGGTVKGSKTHGWKFIARSPAATGGLKTPNIKLLGDPVRLFGSESHGLLEAKGMTGRMNLLAEKNIRNGQLLGTQAIPGLKNIDSMSNLGRGIDAGIKIAPKVLSVPGHVHDLGDQLHQSAAAH